MTNSMLVTVMYMGLLNTVYMSSIADIGTIVHLYEWRYSDIAKECENFLGPNGYKGIQVSPVTENIIINGRPWWEKYQVISYKIISRSGNEEDFKDMVSRCNKVGVNIYVDIVLNDMSSTFANAKGTGGSTADTANFDYPAVPFTSKDFHQPTCSCYDWNNAENVRNCELNGLHDLNMTTPYVRKVQIEFLNHLINLGVAGFRVDAAKHMWPKDLQYIFSQLKDLKTQKGSRLFVYLNVIDPGNEGTHYSDYTSIGPVTDFKYGQELGKIFRENSVTSLKNWGSAFNLINSSDTIVFLHNHDNNRGSGTGTPYVLTYQDGLLFKQASAFMISWPHGIPRVMSSYAYNNWNDGAPKDAKDNILPVIVNSDNSCGNGWNCEHRYKEIAGMVQFKNVVEGTKVKQWYDNGSGQIAFCRGNKGFAAFNMDFYNFDKTLKVCLPPGKYCDIISGKLVNGKCTGKVIKVNRKRQAHIRIPNYDPSMLLAFHIKSKIHRRSHNVEKNTLEEENPRSVSQCK